MVVESDAAVLSAAARLRETFSGTAALGRFRSAVVTGLVSLVVVSVAFAGENAKPSELSALPSVQSSGLSTGRAVTLHDIFSTYDLGGMAGQGLKVSPNGKYVAFQMHRARLERNDYEAGWYVLDLGNPEKGPFFVAEAGDPLLFRGRDGTGINGAWVSTNPVWSPDSKWFAYRRMDGGSVQVWRTSVDGTVSEQLTHSPANVEAFWWTRDGEEIWFEVGATPEEKSAYLRSKWEHGIWVGDDNFDPSVATYVLRPYEVTSGRPRVRILDLRTGHTRHATETEIQRHFESNSVSLNPYVMRLDRSVRIPERPLSRGVTISSDRSRIGWLEAQVDAIRPNLRVHAKFNHREAICDVEECYGQIRQLWWSQDGRELIFSRREGVNGWRIVLYGWHVEKNVVRQIYVQEARHLSACSSTGHSLICFSDQPSNPRTLVSLQFADGSLKELYNPNPWFDQIHTGTAELLEWENKFEITTFGWLIKPPRYEQGRRYPLVIIQYRARDCFKGGTGYEYPAHLFAAEGFVVLCFDQPELQGLSATLTMDEYLQAAWDDYYQKRVILSSLESVIDLLDKRGLIDRTKIGITGLSSGADTISYALANSNYFTTAIVSSFGWSPTGYFFASAKERAIGSKLGFGRPGTADGRYWSGMSPGMQLQKIQTPLLIQVSDDEAPSAMFNYVMLHENGHPVDMYVFADEYHVKWHPNNRMATARRAVDWMRFWLKGERDADSTKVDEYARWQNMRDAQTVRAADATSAGDRCDGYKM